MSESHFPEYETDRADTPDVPTATMFSCTAERSNFCMVVRQQILEEVAAVSSAVHI